MINAWNNKSLETKRYFKGNFDKINWKYIFFKKKRK